MGGGKKRWRSASVVKILVVFSFFLALLCFWKVVGCRSLRDTAAVVPTLGVIQPPSLSTLGLAKQLEPIEPENVDYSHYESVYQAQMPERKKKSPPEVSRIYDSIGANYPCLWGGAPVWGEDSDYPKQQDGWKWICGLNSISKPCVVYAIGSRNDIVFEIGVRKARPDCTVVIIDPTDLPPQTIADKYNFVLKQQMLRTKSHDKTIMHKGKPFPLHERTLEDMTKENGHNFIDILKVDVEGYENEAFTGMPVETLGVVGQLAVEVHKVDELEKLVRYLEDRGFRLWHKERNPFARWCAELAFIQKGWRPECKRYKLGECVLL